MILILTIITTVSGEPCVEPVCTPAGHIYEKRLLLKHIEANGTDPVTKEPLSLESLIALETSPDLASVRPRAPSQLSLPSLLSFFQNEWDALMLETFNLRTQLQVTKQELHRTSFQFDAACRVIARLTKEKEQLESQVNSLKSKSSGKGSSDMDIENQYPGLSDDIKIRIDKSLEEMKVKRSNRKVSPSLASKEEIQRYSCLDSYPVHKASAPGILSVDIHPDSESNLFLTGGIDKTAVIFNRKTGKKVSTLSDHTKPVLDARFIPQTPETIVTASEDQTVKVWNPSKRSSYACEFTMQVHNEPITGFELHPLGDLAITSSKDKTWAMYDLSQGQILSQQTDFSIESGLSCIKVHPDGAILATGGEDSFIYVWDVKTQKLVTTLRDFHTGKILDLSFSENGVYLASSSEDNQIGIWDLRSPSIKHAIKVDSAPNKIAFDYSGKYLAAACESELRIFTGRNLDFVQAFDDHTSQITGVKWGIDATWLVTSSLDRTIKIWGKED